jgi:hypothetical protein
MSIIVSAVEVGSVRALAPVCRELLAYGEEILIDKRGFFTDEELIDLEPFLVTFPDNRQELLPFLEQYNVKSLLFSVNVHNPYPLMLARILDAKGIKTVHVLDYWNGYSSRMKLDGNTLFQPTRYIVPDEYAAKMAIGEGINEDRIAVMGQPAIADVEESYRLSSVKVSSPIKGLFPESDKVILFVSEPVSADQGNSLQENENYRGYVERDALQILLEAVVQTAGQFRVCVIPHPRQSARELRNLWTSLGGDQYGAVLGGIRGRDLLPFVDGVSGMASTLLYEAWLVGKPILSIQPGLLNNSARMLEYKENVVFIDEYRSAEKKVVEWIKSLKKELKVHFHPDLEMHKNASNRIAQEVRVK